MLPLPVHPTQWRQQGARIIKQNLGEPKPDPEKPADPNLKNWSVHVIRGKKVGELRIRAGA
jgi:hypothetical protein